MYPIVAVVAISVWIVGATMLGGPPAGMAASFVSAATIVILAARARPDTSIEADPGPGNRILVIACTPLDRPEALESIVTLAQVSDPAGAQALIVAPAAMGRVASWTSDLAAGRVAAAERLVVALAGLAAAGVDAIGRVGDTDPLMATEDALRTWPAGKVLFIHDFADERAAAAAAEVSRRAMVPVRVVALSGVGASH
jgi:hypothetical protein